MRRGKEIAQGAHASMAAILNFIAIPFSLGFQDPRVEPWLSGNFKKVCVTVNSEDELLALVEKAKSSNVIQALITDSGLTEFGGVPTVTCAAIGPDTEDNVNEITGNLKLY